MSQHFEVGDRVERLGSFREESWDAGSNLPTSLWDSALGKLGTVIQRRPSKPRGHAVVWIVVQPDTPNYGEFWMEPSQLRKVKSE